MDPAEVAERQARAQRLLAPLPWPKSTTEVMVDAMSVIRYALLLQQKKRMDIDFEHDQHSLWPTRVFMAAQALTKTYGKDRPPSPWKPIIVVYDQPDPKETTSGLKIRSWKNLYKSGPRWAGGVTLGWAQTYVDQSAAERHRSDREMLYMLELITRDFPDRRQVLVTYDQNLEGLASKYAEVRSPQWFFKEVESTGAWGKSAIQALMGSTKETGRAFSMLPPAVKKAFSYR